MDETAEEPREQVSHGICEECAAKARQSTGPACCPLCRVVELKELPTRVGRLPHFRCPECKTVLARTAEGEWIPCESPGQHLPGYVSGSLLEAEAAGNH